MKSNNQHIPWKLSTNFNHQRHLFYNKVDTDYIIETYICTCGHESFIVCNANQELDYICEECANTKFYDANLAWSNMPHFISTNEELDVEFHYTFSADEEKITADYSLTIPTDIDFLQEEIFYDERAVCSVVLSDDGIIDEIYLLMFDREDISGIDDYQCPNDEILKRLNTNLLDYIKKNGCFGIHGSRKNDFTLAHVHFFLQHQNLKDFDFYYWNDVDYLNEGKWSIESALVNLLNRRTEKSLKKAININYAKQRKESNTFYANFIGVFTVHIEDVNILRECLGLEFDSDTYRSIGGSLHRLVGFLKRHYTDKQILNFFKSITTVRDSELLRDSINQYSYIQDTIENNFNKVKCNLDAIHDELLRCAIEIKREESADVKLSYTDKELAYCHIIDGYEVVLPQNAQDLFDWAYTLRNCLTGYLDNIKNKYTCLFVYFIK